MGMYSDNRFIMNFQKTATDFQKTATDFQKKKWLGLRK